METGKKGQPEESEKTKEEILAERKAKKAEKAAKKSQPVNKTTGQEIVSDPIQNAKETGILENKSFLKHVLGRPICYFRKSCEG